MKKAIALMFLLALGCAGAVDDELFGDEMEFGTVEQPFGAKVTSNFAYGTNTGPSRLKCNKGSASQVCSIPVKKTLRVCVQYAPGGSGFASAVQTQILNDISAVNTTLSSTGWSYQLDGDVIFGSCCDTCTLSGQAPDIVVRSAAVGSSGTGSSDIRDYALASFSGITALTEGAGVVGNYQTHARCSIAIDQTDILAKGNSNANDMRGVDHSILHTLLACSGVGARSTNTSLASRVKFDPNNSAATNISTGESCQMTSFTTAGAGQFNLVSPACSSD